MTTRIAGIIIEKWLALVIPIRAAKTKEMTKILSKIPITCPIIVYFAGITETLIEVALSMPLILNAIMYSP